MPPSPIPAPVPPWAKLLLQLLPLVSGYLYDLLEYAGTQSAESDEWRRLAVQFKTSASTLTQDYAYCTFDVANITGGAIDSSWTTTDYTTCEAKFDTFFAAYGPTMSGIATISEYRWYKRAFNDMSVVKPFPPMGPPERVTPKTITGSGGNSMPGQVAISVTEKTAWPKHWGRFYLPFPSQGSTVDGRISSAATNALATAAGTLYHDLAAAEFQPVVPVTQVNKVPTRGLLQVNQIQVDNTFDVIRRRRFYNPSLRVIKP